MIFQKQQSQNCFFWVFVPCKVWLGLRTRLSAQGQSQTCDLEPPLHRQPSLSQWKCSSRQLRQLSAPSPIIYLVVSLSPFWMILKDSPCMSVELFCPLIPWLWDSHGSDFL